MSFTYGQSEGYSFFNYIFSVICTDQQMKSEFNENVTDSGNIGSAAVVKDYLCSCWVKFASDVLNRNPDLRSRVLAHFNRYHDYQSSMNEIKSRLDSFEKTLPANLADVLEKRKVTRDPKFSLGIAAFFSIALIAGQASPDFYIGTEEAKKILFRCMEKYDYSNFEYIPDRCFEDKEKLSLLLFSALYSTMMVLFPARGNVRESNCSKGRDELSDVLHDDSLADFYTALGKVSEAEHIASKLWDPVYSGEPHLNTESPGTVAIGPGYMIPEIQSDSKKMSIMTHETGVPVRSLVESRCGAGKSTLGRMISALSLCSDAGSYKCLQMLRLIDINAKMWTVTIQCGSLRPDELKKGLIRCGLDQMLRRANSLGAGISNIHYEECIEYILTFCSHKRLQESLLLIVDDYSKTPPECAAALKEQLREMCADPRQHIVIFTNKLKPSEKFRLREIFNGFSLTDLSPETLSHDFLADVSDEKEQFFRLYANTPRRIDRCIRALKSRECMSDILSSFIEDELDRCGNYFENREEYPLFLRELTLWVLKRRSDADRRAGRLTVSEKQVVGFLNAHRDEYMDWQKIWQRITLESFVLEQCGGVNNMEFSTPMYFYGIMTSYYSDLLTGILQDLTSGRFLDEFALLSGEEFAHILLILFEKLEQDGFRFVSEEKMGFFMKAVVSKLFELDTYEDVEYGKWAAGKLVSNTEYEKAFMRSGRDAGPARMWDMLKRAYTALDICMDSYRELDLLKR